MTVEEQIEFDRIRAELAAEFGSATARRFIRAELHPADLPPPAVTTRAARQVWRCTFRIPWPDGWVVHWRDDFPAEISDSLGCTLPNSRTIVLNWLLLKDDNEPLFTLIHELVHLKFPQLKHGAEFRKIVSLTYARLLGEPRPAQMLELRMRARRFKRGDQRRRRALYTRIRELDREIRAAHTPAAASTEER